MAEPSELRNLLAETVTASETAAEPAQSEKPVPATEAPEKPETPSGERARGPDGKFLPKEAAETEEPGEEPPETEGEEPETEPETPEVKEPKADVPAHWSQADKDLVAKLPAEHRQAVVDRYKAIEAGFTPKLMRAAELEKQFGGAEELFKPYAEMLRQRNQTYSDVVKAWHSVEREFQEGLQDARMGRPNVKGAMLVARIIQQYGVDPGAVAAVLQGQSPAQTNGAAPAAPQVPPELWQEINSIKQWQKDTEQKTQTAALSTAERQIETFSQEKDAAGNLAHPYFSELEQDMMALARLDQAQGKPIDLADLYDRAAYANRETRTKLLAASEAQAKQKAAADRKAKAAAAQRASSSVTGSPVTGQSPNEERGKHKTLHDTIVEAATEHEAV